jgi:hypothetical protein
MGICLISAVVPTLIKKQTGKNQEEILHFHGTFQNHPSYYASMKKGDNV